MEPLQCIVIPLPGGIIVADAWSNGRTCVTWRQTCSKAVSPCASPVHPIAFVIEHGERALLRLGLNTTIGLGPSKNEIEKGTFGWSSHTKATCASVLSRSTCASLSDDHTEERDAKRMKIFNELFIKSSNCYQVRALEVDLHRCKGHI